MEPVASCCPKHCRNILLTWPWSSFMPKFYNTLRHSVEVCPKKTGGRSLWGYTHVRPNITPLTFLTCDHFILYKLLASKPSEVLCQSVHIKPSVNRPTETKYTSFAPHKMAALKHRCKPTKRLNRDSIKILTISLSITTT